MKTLCTMMMLSLLALGCSAPLDSANDSSSYDDAEVDSTTEASTIKRTDWTAELTVRQGTWGGEFRQELYCNPGTWAVGVIQRVESSQGSGDDTGLNSIKLDCAATRGGASKEKFDVFSNALYGLWGGEAKCSSGFLSGARLWYEPGQGSGDDTAADGSDWSCTSGSNVTPNNNITFPNSSPRQQWSNWAVCGPHTAVCGASIQYEDSQGSGDDTAMNGLRIECCAAPI